MLSSLRPITSGCGASTSRLPLPPRCLNGPLVRHGFQGPPSQLRLTRSNALLRPTARPCGKPVRSSLVYDGLPSCSFASAARAQAGPASSSGTTVAQYLKVRLEQLGLDRLFTIAGNYTAPFLDTILEDKSPIQVTGVSSELVAGYAADGYARFRGIAAVAVTYGVGAFSILNPIVGSDVENIPVVLINGGPTDKEVQNNKRAGLLYSHFTANPDADLEVYRKTTAAAVKITNAVQAPYQIDSALSACVSEMRPVYIEVAEDVWRSPCAAPEGALTRTVTRLSRSNTDQAVKAVMDLIHANSLKGPPAFWVGHEAQRLGVTDKLLALINDTKTQYFTSLMGKSIISEDNPLYLGVHSPTSPPPVKSPVFRDFGSIIGLGALTTGLDTDDTDVIASNLALVSQGGAFVGPTFYPTVPLGDFLGQLREAMLKAKKDRAAATALKPRPQLLTASHLLKGSQGLEYDAFYSVLGDWVKKTSPMIVSDAGFCLGGAGSLHISKPNNFVASAAWLAIGYAPPSAIGVKCANPSSRVVAITGDGAFQETCQAVSSYAHLGHNTVIFVLANGLYGVEQLLANPNPFRKPPTMYPDTLENTPFPYNHLHPWKYEKLADVFGGTGLLVTTVDELRAALVQIDSRPNDCFIVHVRVPMLSVPGHIKPENEIGEDEKSHPKYPPADLF